MCTIYDIHATIDLNDAHCESTRQDAPNKETPVLALAAYNPEYDSVLSGAHRMYSFAVSTAEVHANLIFEVELTMTTTNTDTPAALEVRLFQGSIPADGNYESERYAAVGKSGMWSLAVSSHDIVQGTYFVVVKGTSGTETLFSLFDSMSFRQTPLHNDIDPCIFCRSLSARLTRISHPLDFEWVDN
jgi:hypothetical protein